MGDSTENLMYRNEVSLKQNSGFPTIGHPRYNYTQ